MGSSITRSEAGGLFLVLEGIEGAGKSTQLGLIGSWLSEAGIPHLLTREPGGTPVGEAIRALVLDRPELEVPPVSELLLIVAARAAFVRDVVRPALSEGKVVVADRYDLSTLAYQGHGRGLDLEDVRRVNAMATGGLEPDLCIVFDVPVRVGLERQRLQRRAADRMEREGSAFLERVRQGYLEAVDELGWARGVEATGAPEEVHAAVRSLLAAEFPETFGPAAGYKGRK